MPRHFHSASLRKGLDMLSHVVVEFAPPMKSLGLSCREARGPGALGREERGSKTHPEGSSNTVSVVLMLSEVQNRSRTP